MRVRSDGESGTRLSHRKLHVSLIFFFDSYPQFITTIIFVEIDCQIAGAVLTHAPVWAASQHHLGLFDSRKSFCR